MIRRALAGLASLGAVGVFMILSGCSGNPASSERRWELIWSDEFDGPAGQAPDAANWDYDVGTDWGNAQLEYDTDRTENVRLDGNGRLAIVAREETFAGRNYTSGRILTRGKFETTYGRVEARILLPIGRGIWPAFWLLGSDFNLVGWPQCGEIDVMEYRGQEPSVVHGSVHGPGYSGGNAVTGRYVLSGEQFNQGFHDFAIEWNADSIEWYVDGQLFLVVRPQDLPGAWVFNHPFYIILNVAVGGNFVGPPDASTNFPQTMLVDWIRVYREIT